MSDDHARLVERKLDSRELLKGKLLHVFTDRVELPDGREGHREWIRHPGAVALVPYRPDRKSVILIRQFRYPVGRVLWELPAGKLDPGESPESCGRRELEEETGWVAGEMDLLQEYLPCVGYADEVIQLYYTEPLRRVEVTLDAGEFLEVHELPLREVRDLLASGAILDGKTLVGLHLLLARLGQDA